MTRDMGTQECRNVGTQERTAAVVSSVAGGLSWSMHSFRHCFCFFWRVVARGVSLLYALHDHRFLYAACINSLTPRICSNDLV